MSKDSKAASVARTIIKMTGPSLPILIGAGAMLLGWELFGRLFGVRPERLPTPTRILFEIWEQAPRLRAHSLITAYEILCGFSLALACSLPAAALITSFPGVHRFASPLISILRRAPLVICTPVFFVWFGFGIWPEILISFVLCFFTMTAGFAVGLDSVPMDMLELVRTMGAGRVRTFFKIHLPASLPCGFSALRTSVAMAMVGVAAGEFAEADQGLGYLMLASASKMETPLLFAALVILSIIGLLLYCLVALLECALISWHVETTRGSAYIARGR